MLTFDLDISIFSSFCTREENFHIESPTDIACRPEIVLTEIFINFVYTYNTSSFEDSTGNLCCIKIVQKLIKIDHKMEQSTGLKSLFFFRKLFILF